MAVQNWSKTASQNTTVDGINIAENCPAGNVNNALRAIMASVRVMYDNLPSSPSNSGYVLKTGGVFTGNPIYQGRGGYLHLTDSSQTSGRVTIQPEGSALPPGSEGDIILSWV